MAPSPRSEGERERAPPESRSEPETAKQRPPPPESPERAGRRRQPPPRRVPRTTPAPPPPESQDDPQDGQAAPRLLRRVRSEPEDSKAAPRGSGVSAGWPAPADEFHPGVALGGVEYSREGALHKPADGQRHQTAVRPPGGELPTEDSWLPRLGSGKSCASLVAASASWRPLARHWWWSCSVPPEGFEWGGKCGRMTPRG